MKKLFEFNQHIGDWRALVQTRDISRGAVTPDKIAPEFVDGVVKPLIDRKTNDLQNQIDSLEIHGMAVSNEFGDDPHIGISQKKLTEEFGGINDELAKGSVHTDEEQELSATQKETARKNIGIEFDPQEVGHNAEVAVLHEVQQLTEEQKVRALNNINGKEYAPEQYSGLGKVILGRNMQYIALPFDGFVDGVTLQVGSLSAEPAAIYFDTINSIFVGVDNLLDPKYYGTWLNGGAYNTEGTLADNDEFKNVNDNTYYKYDDGSLVALSNGTKINILTQSMMNKANTVYVIQYDYDLNDPDGENPITIPDNCVLEFDGGSLDNGVLNCNNCGIKASETAVIFKSNLNLKGVKEVCAAWIGILPTTWNVDSGSSNLIHFTQANINGYSGFTIKFLKGTYTFTITDLLLTQHTKLIGAENKATKFYINAANDNFEYIFGVNRHCRIANIDLTFLSHSASYHNCDIFRVSNKWLTDIDAQDTFKINYDYSFENLWIKGNIENSIDDRINGIGIRFVDKEENTESLYPVRSMSGPQMCRNVTIEMVRTGIVISCVVNSGTIDASYVNGLVFDSIFIQGKFGFEYISSDKSGSSGHNYISNYLFQGGSNRYGIYGWCRSEEITNYIAWDSNSLGMAKGSVILSNARFTNITNIDTTLVNGFNKLDNEVVSVYFIPFKVNKLHLFPTAYDPNSGVVSHTVDYSENYKRSWRTRIDNDHPYMLEETINQYGNFTKELVGPSKITEQENLYGTYKGIRKIAYIQTGVTRVLDYNMVPTYGAYQDNSRITTFDKQGFVTITKTVANTAFTMDDILSCELNITSTESLSTSFILIKNLFFTGGYVYINSITNNSSGITVSFTLVIKKATNLANDVVGVTFKIADRADGVYKKDETQSLWFTDKITYSIGSATLVRKCIGTTTERPTSGVYKGCRYFDTTLNKPVWYNGTAWVDATGATV